MNRAHRLVVRRSGMLRAILGVAVGLAWTAHGEQIIRVADINPGAGGGQAEWPTVLNDLLYFTANDVVGGSNNELWQYDGDAASLAAEIRPGPIGSNPWGITAFNGKLYFGASGETGPPRLYQYDGNTTSLAPDAYTSQNPDELIVYNGNLYFRGTFFGVYGIELIKFTGNDQIPIDIFPGTGSSYPQQMIIYDDDLYFNASNQLWRYNDAEGAVLVDADMNPRSPAVHEGKLYFSHYDDEIGNELWRYDPVSGAQLVADIRPGGAFGSGNPYGMTTYNGAMFFGAEDNDDHGVELWRYDGVSATMIANINPTPPAPGGDDFTADSNPGNLFVFNGVLYFTANDGVHGTELWRYDDINGVQLVADIYPGPEGSYPQSFTEYRGKLYFSANNGETGGELGMLGQGMFELTPPPAPNPVVIAFTEFNEPTLGDAAYVPGTGASEIGFATTSSNTGANPFVGVVETSTTPTSPIFSHRSVDATTTFDVVALGDFVAVDVSLILQVRDTTFEADDHLRVYVTNGTETIDLVIAQGVSGGGDPLDDLAGTGYHAYSAAIPNAWNAAWLVIDSLSNSSAGSERYDFDSIAFTGLLLGDIDFDGEVNSVDIDRLFAALGLNDRLYDLDGSGGPADFADVAYLVRQRLGSEFGDVNLDRDIDINDLSRLAVMFGQPGAWADGDFNGDGMVTIADLSVLATQFGFVGPVGAGTAVPEPATWTALATGFAALLRRARTRPTCRFTSRRRAAA